jgi:hypothetical protein
MEAVSVSIVTLQKAEEERPIILALDRHMKIDTAYFLLGQALSRIEAFSEKYDTDADPKVMSKEVAQDFVKERDSEYLVIVAVREGVVIGHFLAKFEVYYGCRYVFLSQLDILGAGLQASEVDYGFEIVTGWAKSLDARGLRLCAPTEAHARIYRKRGFGQRLTVMELNFL